MPQNAQQFYQAFAQGCEPASDEPSCSIPDTGMDQDFIVWGRKDAADVSLQQAQLDERGHVGRDLLVRPSEG